MPYVKVKSQARMPLCTIFMTYCRSINSRDSRGTNNRLERV